jgi:ankyrin repeat protein
MAFATLPVELIRLIVETVKINAEELPASDYDDDFGPKDSVSFFYRHSPEGENSDDEGVPKISPLDPEIRLADLTPDGQRLRRILNTKDLNALAQSCRRLGSVVNSLLYEANREFQASSAVFWAAAAGRTETLARAMQHGLNIDDRIVTQHDSPPLLLSFGLDIHHEWRPAQIALKFGQHDTMEWLLDHGADLDDPVRFTEHENGISFEAAYPASSLLFLALEQQKEDVIVRLVRRGSRLLFAFEDSPVTDSALHLAAQAGLQNLVKLLIQEYGMDPNLALGMPWPSTPLNDAAGRENSVAIVDTLLRHGADINESGKHICATPDCERRVSHRRTPLKAALQERQYANARILLERGARVDSDITTFFYRYCPDGSEEGLQVLGMLIRDHGVDINAPDPKHQKTAFGEACWRGIGDESLIKFMLENGVDPDKPNGRNREIPLFLVGMKADYNCHARLVGLLLDHGANPNCYVDKKRQQTWLQTVKTCTNTEALQELLEVLPGRGLDLPLEELRARANSSRYNSRAVRLRDNSPPYA